MVVVGGGWWVVGHEPVHDSLHVTYRLLAPGTEPSRGPQPIIIKLIAQGRAGGKEQDKRGRRSSRGSRAQ